MRTQEMREEAAEGLVWRSITRAHLEASSARLEKEAARLKERCEEQGLEASTWFETAIAGIQGARKALKEEGV